MVAVVNNANYTQRALSSFDAAPGQALVSQGQHFPKASGDPQRLSPRTELARNISAEELAAGYIRVYTYIYIYI